MRKWCGFVCTTVADPILESYQIMFSHRLWRLWPPPTSDLVIPTLAPRNLLGPWASTSPPNKKHLDRFIRFCRTHMKVSLSVGQNIESCGTAEPIRCRLGAVDSRIYLFTGCGCIDVPYWCTSSWLSFLAADRTSRLSLLKKSICCVRLFSSRFLKQFMDWASTSSCDRLFHLLMTLWEKKIMLLRQFPSVPFGWSGRRWCTLAPLGEYDGTSVRWRLCGLSLLATITVTTYVLKVRKLWFYFIVFIVFLYIMYSLFLIYILLLGQL